MARKLAAVVFSLGALQAESVLALGLGELKLDSYLNEPLKASVDLLNTDGLHGDEIKIRLATREDFKKLGLDRSYFLTSIKFDVQVHDGTARIVMTSDEPVLEPYLDFIVEARWPSGRLLREYTVLIDPPVFADVEATPVVSASQRVEEVEGIPAPTKKKSVESTGTTVDVRKSDLAPGMMPQRDFNAQTAAVPMAGSNYMVHRDQTLWEIASQAKPDGVTVHQTMLDIQRLNPNAFINGNINNMKAGYIIYLPTAEDISSGDVATALAEVKQQNQEWAESRAGVTTSSGPSLRISAEPEVEESYGEPGGTGDGGSIGMGGQAAGVDSDDTDGAELSSLQQQVDTLKRMVDVKDEQIAALQEALADAQSGADEAEAELIDAGEDDIYSEEEIAEQVSEDLAAEIDSEEAAEEAVEEDAADSVAQAEPAPAPVAEKPAAKPATPKGATHTPPESGGIMDYIYYLVGALVLLIVGIFIARRKGDDGDTEVAAAPVAQKAPAAPAPAPKEPPVAAPVATAAPAAAAEDDAGDRGYGEHKHDAYASDVEAADALAEADIYIAYGRHRQAIDLLDNALANEPDNPVYRLKLVEIYAELNDRGAATAQLEKLHATGDDASIARAEAVMERFNSEAEQADTEILSEPEPEVVDADAPGLAPNPLELMSDSGDELESDFAGLEIETDEDDEEDDDLDLSADFEDDDDDIDDEEELVIAADANGLSTKMDLARAYLDMGDDDGARQILEEVVAEGSEELQAEARALLERIG